MSVYVGLDIGGTKIIVASANASGAILKRSHSLTPQALDEGLALLNAMIEEVADGSPIAGIGAAIGGPLDFRKGIVSPLHQPKWRDVYLKEIMESRWKCPLAVDVDTNVAALGEYESLLEIHGQDARGTQDVPRASCPWISRDNIPRFMYITVSTGMGGGFLIDGNIYRGMNDEHPEVGHQSVPFRCSHPERVECECGAPDCLEGLVSGNGIRRVYGKPAEELTEPEWDEVAYNLGQGLRNVAVIYLPDVIVLGGGVALGGGERLLGRVRTLLEERLRLVPLPLVRLSPLGYDSALLGAIALAQRENPPAPHPNPLPQGGERGPAKEGGQDAHPPIPSPRLGGEG